MSGGIKRFLSLWRVIVLACLISTGCAYNLPVTVTTSYNPERNLSEAKRFSLFPTDGERPGIEKALLNMIKERLLRKGCVYDEKNPDFLVRAALHSYMAQFSSPPRLFTVLVPVPGGGYENRSYVADGYMERDYRRAMEVSFVDYREFVASGKVETIWQGMAESTGPVSDTLAVASAMLDQILGEFPRQTGKSAVRRVPLSGKGLE